MVSKRQQVKAQSLVVVLNDYSSPGGNGISLALSMPATLPTVWRQGNCHSSPHNFLFLYQWLAGLSASEQLQSHVSDTGYVSKKLEGKKTPLPTAVERKF